MERNKRNKAGYEARWELNNVVVFIKQVNYSYEVDWFLDEEWQSTNFLDDRKDAIWKAKEILKIKGGVENGKR